MIRGLFLNGQRTAPETAGPPVDALAPVREALVKGQQYLRALPIDALVGFVEAAAATWAERGSPIQQRYARQGLAFLLAWSRASHLRQILDESLRGNRHVLDGFAQVPGVPSRMVAHPRGVVCHWLAGNVPMLGMLSLLQGLLTKNANLVKVASDQADVVPNLVAAWASCRYQAPGGSEVLGTELVKSIAVIAFDHQDREAQRQLSACADVRVAWGGLDAVETIMNLPRRYGCVDIIFGPRTSFMVIGKETLGSVEAAKALARRAATDASLFDQQGCNSPHTAFVERGGAVTPIAFAQLLAEAMAEALTRHPVDPAQPVDTQQILRLRAEYDMRGQAFCSSDTAWTILYAEEDRGLATPCYHRTIFVRPISDLFEVIAYCSPLTQSAGVALEPERKAAFTHQAMARGVDRCPEIGLMSAYEVPWDGVFAMDQMVRWGKLP